MGVLRPTRYASGAWRADSYSDLATIQAEHGDEAYVIDEGVWYKYDFYVGQWRSVSTSPPVS